MHGSKESLLTGNSVVDRVSSTTTAQTTSSSSSSSSAAESKTLVWKTVNGQATQLPYTQSFKSMYSTLHTPSSGSIGLGTIKGTVGKVRTERFMTITK
ncbi:hypothetical protein TRICI_006499 [Trichomonascus ciferrii]|uniref:Uncharacterized protein n=1 Tax=Trichomonascus ciferrii TaxID=44093 RepID=A0A642UGV1_9ASCO|nr:hypothetical protein TRICI_006499 [Trichomonascus ciferrii]